MAQIEIIDRKANYVAVLKQLDFGCDMSAEDALNIYSFDERKSCEANDGVLFVTAHRDTIFSVGAEDVDTLETEGWKLIEATYHEHTYTTIRLGYHAGWDSSRSYFAIPPQSYREGINADYCEEFSNWCNGWEWGSFVYELDADDAELPDDAVTPTDEILERATEVDGCWGFFTEAAAESLARDTLARLASRHSQP